MHMHDISPNSTKHYNTECTHSWGVCLRYDDKTHHCHKRPLEHTLRSKHRCICGATDNNGNAKE